MMALATTQKGNMSISEYIAKIKPFVDEMAPARKGLEDEELVSYILAGLDFDYNPIVSAIVAHVEPISVGELYSRLLNFEARWEPAQGGQQPYANAARRGRGELGPSGHGGLGPGGRGHGHGHGGGFFSLEETLVVRKTRFHVKSVENRALCYRLLA
jgi:hypothetical protein